MGRSKEHLTIAIRVKPGARVPRVGGSWGEGCELVVAVAQRAVDGAANAAVVAALSAAFGVPKSDVTLVRGGRSRSKIIAVTGDAEALTARLDELRVAR